MANTLTFDSLILTDADLFGGINYMIDLNDGEEFSIGNTASAEVSFVTTTQLPLYTKDAVNGTFVWDVDGTDKGRYYITEVTKAQGFYTITAYDAMLLLDTSIEALSLTYPLSVSDAIDEAAGFIGCTVSGTVNNAAMTTDALEETTTIRQLLSWAAEASGCSVRINGSDELCLMYYADSGITVTASEYRTLEKADYTCAPIDQVAILNEEGIVCGTAGSGTNALFIQANPFLGEATNTQAAVILGVVDGITYAPITCDMFDENGIEVGTMATFGTVTAPVMHLESSEDGAIVSCVGSDSRAELNLSEGIRLYRAGTTASHYLTDITGGGVFVHEDDPDDPDGSGVNDNGVRITDKVDIIRGGSSVAEFGTTARVGDASAMHFEIASDEISAEYDDTPVMKIKPYGSLTNGNAVDIYADTAKSKTNLHFANSASQVSAYAMLKVSDETDSQRYSALDMEMGSLGDYAVLSVQKSSGISYVRVDNGNTSPRVELNAAGGANLAVRHDDVLITKSLKVEGHGTAIGYRNAGNGTKSVNTGSASNTKLTDTAVSISAGTWLLIGSAEFPASATGVRHLAWADGSTVLQNSRMTVPASSGGLATRLQVTATVSADSAKSMNLYAFQTSGAAQTVSWCWQIVRIA